MTSYSQVRRQLDELPMLAALAPLFAEPGGSSGAEPTGGSGSDPARAPLRLEVLDLLDRRQREPIRDDGEDWIWRDGRTGRGIEEPDALAGGVLGVLGTWCIHVDAELWQAGELHDELWLEACTANCEQALERAKHLSTEGPCDDRPRRHTVTSTVAGAVDFLLLHLSWSAKRDWFAELADDVGRLNHELRMLLRWPQADRATCEKCGWAMEPMGDWDPATHRYPWYRCTGCPATVTTATAIEKAHSEARDTVTLGYAAEQIGRPAATLRWWKHKGWLSPVGKDGRGDVYSLSAVRVLSYQLQRNAELDLNRKSQHA